MKEIHDESVHLVVTSPPYYNAPFHYPDLFRDYDEFFGLIRDLSRDLYRVLALAESLVLSLMTCL